MLRAVDRKVLDDQGFSFKEYARGEMTLLVISDYVLPGGYEPATTDLLLQIPSSYPDGKIDMWWVFPHVTFARTGQMPVNANVFETFAAFTPDPARSWQRFSRHPEWRPGTDDLRGFMRAVRMTLEAEARQAAA
jgi:hypothetical protein